MNKEDIIEKWKTEYKSKHGIPQNQFISNEELLEQFAIDSISPQQQTDSLAILILNP